MSRNFEVLERNAKEELLTPEGMPAIFRPPAHFPALKGYAKEEITKLVQRLFFRGGHAGGPRIVSFSGMARDDRSSWICARAGETLASRGNASVCLVDANFRSPRLHTHYETDNSGGFAAALTATTEGLVRRFAIPLPNKHLWLMPSGSPKQGFEPDPESCRARFAELREEFDYVLISAPPITRETEATLMGQLADGIVLVVEANQTRRETIQQVQEHLEVAQVQILGGVLDQRRFPIPEFLYRRL